MPTRSQPANREAHLYLRISRDEAGDRLGVARQEKSLRELASRNGWTVASVHTDNDVSAFRGRRRPGYETLLATVAAGDVILCTEVSRLTRHPRELEDLVEFVDRSKVDITALRAGQLDLSTSGGRMIARVLGSIARHEAEQLGERVSSRHRQNATAGKAHGGGAPYGYRRVAGSPGELEIDAEHAEVVRWMIDRVFAGASVNRLVIELNERGIRSPRGGHWQTSSVGKLLRSPTIAGLRVAGGEIIGPANWPAIIDRATHERLVATLAHAPVGPRVRRNLLAGFIYCGECGGRLYGRTEGKSAKYPNRNYACDRSKGGGGCGSNSASADNVEQYIVNFVLETAATVDVSPARARQSGTDAARLTADLVADEQLLADLASDLGDRRITRAEWLAARDPVVERIAHAKRRLGETTTPVPVAIDTMSPAQWETLTFDQRRAVISLFVERVVIAKGKPGRSFDPSRILVVPVDHA